MPEYTSIVIRQTSPSSTLLPPHQDIEEVAIESLPEMVTELFDSIPQSTIGGGMITPSNRLYSSEPIISKITTPVNVTNRMEQAASVRSNLMNSPDMKSFSPSYMQHGKEHEGNLSLTSPFKPLNIEGQYKFDTNRLTQYMNSTISTAQKRQEPQRQPIILAQNGVYNSSQQPAAAVGKFKMEQDNDSHSKKEQFDNTVEDDKSKLVVVAQQDNYEDIQFLTDILQNSIDENIQKEPPKTIHSSTLDDIKFDAMDTLYADGNQYTNPTSLEIYKDEDINSTEKSEDQGMIGSCSWDTSSSASTASSIGSHFEFSCSQDFSDMMSDFGVSEIDWGSVDMIKI